MPYDGGFLSEPKDTGDVLMSLPLLSNDDLFNDLVDAFTIDAWVDAGQGHWATPHPNEVYQYSWYRFAEWIKHETRFFFSRAAYSALDDDPHGIEPRRMLPLIAQLVSDLRLVTTQAFEQKLYRVRVREPSETWPADEAELGAPPSGKARAGRMNPAGISYLYLALDEVTAVAEVVRSPPAQAVVAEFATTRELRILDLTHLPPEPSIFDSSQREQREGLLFLQKFVEEICKPITRDGREHIEYVPSQVVSEFFALQFQDAERRGVDGIVYPSAAKQGGKNLVLFPTARGLDRRFDMVRFHASREQPVL
jgi:RES domain-containing protein